MNRCPLTKELCGQEQCPLWVKLSDYEGCPFDISDRAIQDFKEKVLLPAARQADELVRAYLDQERRRGEKK